MACAIAIVAIVWIAISSNKTANKSDSSSKENIADGTGDDLYYSNSDDSSYYYRFNKTTRKLSRISRNSSEQTGEAMDFFMVEKIGATDTTGKTIVRGTAKEGALSQLYVCDFISACKPVDINISQILLTPNNTMMAVKFDADEYHFGYYSPSENKLDNVYTLEGDEYDIELISEDQAILFPQATSLDSNPLSILSLPEKKISKKIDQANYIAVSPSKNKILYDKSENDKHSIYLYDINLEKKIKINSQNFHNFFFSQNGDLYEIVPGDQTKLILHSFETGEDQTQEVKSLSTAKDTQIAEILYITGGKYLLVFGNGQSQEFDFGVDK